MGFCLQWLHYVTCRFYLYDSDKTGTTHKNTMRLLTAALPSSYVVTEMLMAYSSTAHTQIYPHRGKQTLRFVLIDLKWWDTEVWISVLGFGNVLYNYK